MNYNHNQQAACGRELNTLRPCFFTGDEVEAGVGSQ